ncbi:hypothetical protein [Radiobacillus sp. PE A8.2]|uniref:hypothetical protein n=1 Tax=Radiobacillus sp. PE A8.2 TaxID=3380349 RepID=UPI003890D833
MDEDLKQTLYAYIILPFVHKLFKRDLSYFETGPFRVNRPYLDKLDTAIASVQDDLNSIKRTLYNKHHMKVRYLGKTGNYLRYDWQTPNDSGDVLLTPDQLRELTKDMMGLYLFGMLARPVEIGDRAWY